MPHEHSVIDTDTHFIIDGRTKVISFAGDNLPVIIQYDHNSERMTFEIPRSIEGHDMTACNKVEVHYINIDKNTKQQKAGAYEVSDMTAPEDSADTVSFSWLISNQATQLIGPLSFLVKFKCVAEDGTVEYEWNTAKFTGLAVQDGINNTEVIAEEYADILAAWDSRIAALEQNPSGVQTINGVAPDDEGNVMLDMPEQVQSDLAVNDESDPAYVKGVIRHESLPDGYPKTENKLIIDATGAEWHVGMGYSLTVSPVDSFIPIIKGNKYIIEMNGASKEVECESNGCIIINDYDLGIVIEINEEEDQTYYLYASYRLPVILKVTAVDALITPIDEKFIPPLSSVTLKSSTEGSSKKFKITVDDSGTLTATEITE